LDIDVVNEYGADMERGDKFPPLVVFNDGKKYWLADGFHRFYAARAVQRTTIHCDVRQGGLREAILFSASVNATHGLRRTNLDKRRAVGRLVLDKEWRKWSDAEIARRCLVSDRFVAKVRKEKTIVPPARGAARLYRTKYGTVALMKLGERASPKKRDAAIVKTLREMARQIEKMPPAGVTLSDLPKDQRHLFTKDRMMALLNWMRGVALKWPDDPEEIKTGAEIIPMRRI
jgi:hypothetical protein